MHAKLTKQDSVTVSTTNDPPVTINVSKSKTHAQRVTVVAPFVKNQCELQLRENYIIRCSVRLEINSPVRVDILRRQCPDWSTRETRPPYPEVRGSARLLLSCVDPR